MNSLGTVRRALSLEAVTLHGSGEALALAGSGDVDVCAVLEDLGGELLADLVVGGVRNAELHYVATRGHTSLGELAGSRLVHLARVDGADDGFFFIFSKFHVDSCLVEPQC